MNVSLTPELENLVNEKVSSGLYNSASEVVREALRLLQEQDELKRIRLDEFRKEIKAGADELRQGRFKSYETADELIDDIEKRGKERLAAKRNGKKQ